MDNQNQQSQENEIKEIEKKKRKTLDQYLGINGLCIIAIIGTILGGILRPIGAVAAISAIYYLIKKRKELKTEQKILGWVLIVAWAVIFGLASGSFVNRE